MADHLSRRKIAGYVAAEAVKGTSMKKLLREVAAYLIETGRTRDYELMVRDIEDALGREGIVIADISTAASEQAVSESAFKHLVPHAKQLIIRNHIDKSLLGGVLVELPGKQLDASIRSRLTKLRSLEG